MVRKLLKLFLFFVGFTLYFGQNNGSVGINTNAPNANSVLDVVSGNNDKGVLIPRLTEAQRNAITLNKSKDDGLTIYNTTEDCFNYWSLADDEWKSVCGQLGKSVFTIDCSNTVAMGSYVQTRELTASNYLKVTVNVTKLGNYTITASTSNGYNFYGTGVFLNLGTQTVQIPGQGTPQNVQIDNLAIDANGIDVTCTPPVSVNVLSPAGTYTMSCGRAIVNGVYKVGVPLNASNTITLPVNVTVKGSYTVTTNTVDGISFSASGENNLLDWTFFSPAIEMHQGTAGVRKGIYRTDLENPVFDDDGRSVLSVEDVAVALVDELENNQFMKQRFTAAY